ncbi:MAG TPA: AmmeMemoRadiSam system protein A [Anaerolineaceae bacterium]|jgi:AmmeMemoRadiSam system protein A|nr:AmmeMemoRadiSam system protein A [Anaerolineaceae bacterium]
MTTIPLTTAERLFLLRLARQSIEAAVNRQSLPGLPPAHLTPALQEQGAAFVTLTLGGNLRGCVGALEPYQPLAEDVREHAVAAAVEDYRFPAVRAHEVPRLHIEISRLTRPQPLSYSSPADLQHRLRPQVDGVILRDGLRRATFLPQVWEQLPDPAEFLSHLCAKMGAASNLWQTQPLTVLIYQVEQFEEESHG